jgi:hypothetical protein
LGDPLRQNIKNAASFFDELRFNNQVLPQFQIKQGVTQKGEPLQTAFPAGETRFLNTEEISALLGTTDRYRSFRFLNLRELSFPRLLTRREFPYDTRHLARENLMGPPPLNDDLYYDAGKNQFVKIEPTVPAAEIQPGPQETVQQEPGTPAPAQQKEIIEFLYNLFQDDETPDKSNPSPLKPIQ